MFRITKYGFFIVYATPENAQSRAEREARDGSRLVVDNLRTEKRVEILTPEEVALRMCQIQS